MDDLTPLEARVLAETMARFYPPPVVKASASAPLPAPVVQPTVRASAVPVTDTRFAAMSSAGKFAALVDGDCPQAAAGMFGRMVAAAGIGCDQPTDRVGDILQAGLRRELSAIWQYVVESQATTPDQYDAVELGLLREVMLSCMASHATTDRRTAFFQSITSEFGNSELSSMAMGWILCR